MFYIIIAQKARLVYVRYCCNNTYSIININNYELVKFYNLQLKEIFSNKCKIKLKKLQKNKSKPKFTLNNLFYYAWFNLQASCDFFLAALFLCSKPFAQA